MRELQQPVLSFRRGLGIVGVCLLLIAASLVLSAAADDADLFFAAVLICPLATAVLSTWTPVWQAVVALVCLGSFAFADFVGIPKAFGLYGWFGLVGAIAIAQVIAQVFHRRHLGIAEQLRTLKHASQSRERETAMIAHEIRSPLGALAGFVNLLQDGRLSQSEWKDVLARMDSLVRKLDLVVGNVLDLYRLEEGRLERRPRPMEPDSVANDVAEGYRLDAERKGLRMVTELHCGASVELDPLHFERIVANLLANAAARTPSGEIRFQTDLRGGKLKIEVIDTGPTPSDSELAEIFERPAPSDIRASANRLGLYVTSALVEAAGGTIEASSRGDGGGLRLAVELPLAPTEQG